MGVGPPHSDKNPLPASFCGYPKLEHCSPPSSGWSTEEPEWEGLCSHGEVGERSPCRGHGAPSPLLLLLESPFFCQPSSREFSEKLPTGSDHFFQSLTLHIPHITGIPWMSKLLQRANSSR